MRAIFTILPNPYDRFLVRDLLVGLAGEEVVGSAGSGHESSDQKNRPGFGGLADATEPGESSGAVLPERAMLKEAGREAAN